MGELSGKLFGRSGSLFGGKNRKRAEQQQQTGQTVQTGEKGRNYPPVSLNYSMPPGDEARTSMDSKRSRKTFSMGLGKKTSGSITGSQTSREKQNRRFSFIPASFSLKAIGIGKDEPQPQLDSQQDLPIQEPPAVDEYGRYIDQHVGREDVDASTLDGMYAQLQDSRPTTDPYGRHNQQQQYSASSGVGYGRPTAALENYMPQQQSQSAMLNAGSDASVDQLNYKPNPMHRPPGSAPQLQHIPSHHAQQDGSGAGYDQRRVASGGPRVAGGSGRGVLQKNKRFVDAWDTDSNSRGHDHSGSSGPARKVMDFFRRRGKARGGEAA
jgi:protein-serine/threonine kinase